VQRSTAFLLQSVGIVALVYPDALSFLAEFDPDEPAVVVLDVRLRGLGGLALQERLNRLGYPAPLIFCSAHGDIPTSVRAMRAGATDFLEQPYDPHHLIEVVQEQLREATRTFALRRARLRLAALVDTLTPRERDVLRLVVLGYSSQRIAEALGSSPKTIDVHRARVRTKTSASSLAGLVRDLLVLGVSV
jgi:two-component system response regulator FixJ